MSARHSGGREHFDQDLARFNAALERLGALVEVEDGSVWVDPAKVPPDLARAYRGLLAYGYANGLI